MTDDTWTRFLADPDSAPARNQLVERYLPLVRAVGERLARSIPPCAVDVDDLCQAGVFGLIEAMRKFRPERRVKFTTFCVLRVRGAMLDELRQNDWVPRLTRARAGKLLAATRELERRHGRPPDDAELAGHLGLSLAEFRALSTHATPVRTVSADAARSYRRDGQDFEDNFLHAVEDGRGADPTARLRYHELLRRATRGLTQRERLCVIGYYFMHRRMAEIGRELGMSESRVSQLLADIRERWESPARQPAPVPRFTIGPFPVFRFTVLTPGVRFMASKQGTVERPVESPAQPGYQASRSLVQLADLITERAAWNFPEDNRNLFREMIRGILTGAQAPRAEGGT